MTILRSTSGYVTHDSGYCGGFSWWRNNLDYRFWTICGHGSFCKDGMAITDDFGSLVEVAR